MNGTLFFIVMGYANHPDFEPGNCFGNIKYFVYLLKNLVCVLKLFYLLFKLRVSFFN